MNTKVPQRKRMTNLDLHSRIDADGVYHRSGQEIISHWHFNPGIRIKRLNGTRRPEVLRMLASKEAVVLNHKPAKAGGVIASVVAPDSGSFRRVVIRLDHDDILPLEAVV